MDKKKIFEAHGVEFTGESGNQIIGRCPFTGKDHKFYVNQQNWLWDSKTAGVSGNLGRFLELTQERYRKQLTPDLLARLALHRKLPLDAFALANLGWNGRAYTLAVRDPAGVVQDIRNYKLEQKMMSTPGCQVGLWGAHLLKDSPAAPVYLCEGEWDALAFRWLKARVNQPGVVLAVPGASTFKAEWVSWISGRVVYVLYDNDGAGEQGDATVYRRLKSSVQALHFLHWPAVLPTGFDLRDWVVAVAVDDKNPDKAWNDLKGWFRPTPRTATPGTAPTPDEATPTPEAGAPAIISSQAPPPYESQWKYTSPSLVDVETVFRKWLYLDSTDAVRVMLAAVVGHQIDGPPLWLFLVSPPGGAKTETLTSLAMCTDFIHATSNLTVHSLISGANFGEGKDMSLIPRLDGKVMVIKDFTSILAMPDAVKEEIFGILRDAYDGTCGKVFGNGIERHYTSRFGLLAAVTPSIYDMSSQHTALGERFLKFTMGDNLHHIHEEMIIHRAIGNISRETLMRAEMQDVILAFVTKTARVNPIPTIPEVTQNQLVHLAMFGARMRGSVSRDQYRNDIIVSRPSAEIGSRLGIQMAKMVKALAIVDGRQVVNADDYRLAKKIILDTIPQRSEDALRHMLKLCPTSADAITAQQLSVDTRYPIATVVRILQDFNVLDIAARSGNVQRYYWTVGPYIRDCVTQSGLYTTPEEQNRVNPEIIKAVKRRSAPVPDPIRRLFRVRRAR